VSNTDPTTKSTFFSTSELSTADVLREAIRETSVIIQGSRKLVNEAALFKASTLKNAHTYSIPIEYWQSYAKRWTTEATLTISKSKTKLHLDFNGLQNEKSLNTSERLNTSEILKYQGRVNQQQRVTFFFYNFVVEHSNPLARNFLAILSGGGQILRHRIAFYSEADGNFATVLFKKFGAQITCCCTFLRLFQIQWSVPSAWNDYIKKKLLHENERNLLNEQVTLLRRESISIGEHLNHPGQTETSNTGDSAMI
jgi:hypothetical protein